MQENVENLTEAVPLLNMSQVSVIIFETMLILTNYVCSKGKIQNKLFFLREKSIYNFFIVDVQKDSPSAAGRTSFCSISSKAHPNF